MKKKKRNPLSNSASHNLRPRANKFVDEKKENAVGMDATSCFQRALISSFFFFF